MIFKTFKKCYITIKKLCTFFAQLLSYPPSSALFERVFSTFVNIWTKLRNRLEAEKARKIAKIHHFLKKIVEEGESEEW